jgi:hypothetical protein
MLPYILSRGALWAKGRLKRCERKSYSNKILLQLMRL